MVAGALTFPASSWTFSVTVNVKYPVAGSGAGGSMPQLNDGVVNTGPVVVCTLGLPETAHVQSYALMAPGALDVLPSKVQSSAPPLLITAHVSVIWRPVTPKLAVATAARVSAIDAVALAPPYDPLIVALVGELTIRVSTLKLALVSPEITITCAGTIAMPSLESVTTAPPPGAGPFSATVAVTFVPPTTVVGFTEIDASRSAVDTVSADDWRLLPFIVAVIVAFPAATPQTANVAEVAPAATWTDAGTVAMPELLLVSPTVAPLPAALVNVTVA